MTTNTTNTTKTIRVPTSSNEYTLVGAIARGATNPRWNDAAKVSLATTAYATWSASHWQRLVGDAEQMTALTELLRQARDRIDDRGEKQMLSRLCNRIDAAIGGEE